MDNEMIKRCETAINKLQDTGETIGVKQVVITVIKAMREPTEKMTAAGNKHTDWASGADDAWQAMIDAIIGDE